VEIIICREVKKITNCNGKRYGKIERNRRVKREAERCNSKEVRIN
jgi:hypothetical protein